MYLGYQNGQIKFYTEEPLDQEFYNLDEVVETQDEYVLDGEEYVLKDEAWEEKQKQAEKERIANIALTRADVFEALILARGLTKQMLRSFIEQDETLSEIERALYLNRFDDALEFYRKHPAIDFISAKLDITPDNMDKFFDTKDYMYLKPTTDVNNSEATGEENPVVEDITDVEDVNSLEG